MGSVPKGYRNATIKAKALAVTSAATNTAEPVGAEQNPADEAENGLDACLSVIEETADDYADVVARLCSDHRVIVDRKNNHWILQQRNPDGSELAWSSNGWFRLRPSLIMWSEIVCSKIEPSAIEALNALPVRFGEER